MGEAKNTELGVNGLVAHFDRLNHQSFVNFDRASTGQLVRVAGGFVGVIGTILALSGLIPSDGSEEPNPARAEAAVDALLEELPATDYINEEWRDAAISETTKENQLKKQKQKENDEADKRVQRGVGATFGFIGTAAYFGGGVYSRKKQAEISEDLNNGLDGVAHEMKILFSGGGLQERYGLRPTTNAQDCLKVKRAATKAISNDTTPGHSDLQVKLDELTGRSAAT